MALAITTGIQWTPLQLSGLRAWYDASNGVYTDAGVTLAADGQTVQQWNDLSGHGYHIKQATSGKRPTYRATGLNSRKTLEFVATANSGLITTTNTFGLKSPTLSVFAVANMRTGTEDNGRLVAFVANGQTLDWDNLNSWAFTRRVNDTRLQINLGGGAFIPWSGVTQFSLATNYRFGFIVDSGSDVTAYINNVTDPPQTSSLAFDFGGASSNGTLFVGTYIADDLTGWDGFISEVIICASEFSAGDRTVLDNYFKAKWGL